MICLLSLVWAMIYVNSALSQYNTNFMYLVRPPMKNLPFLTLDYGWYVYFLHILTLTAEIDNETLKKTVEDQGYTVLGIE